MKNINYIDLGVHVGQEIDLFLRQFKNSNEYSIRIYGVEADQSIYNRLVEKYKDNKNIEIFHNAINDKNEPVNLYMAHNEGLGSSIFSTKRNVTDEFQTTEGITFNDFIKNNVEEYLNCYLVNFRFVFIFLWFTNSKYLKLAQSPLT